VGAAQGALLLGAPRRRRRPPAADQRGQAFPGGEIYRSFPGLGDRLAASVAGEIGDHLHPFRLTERAGMLRRHRPGHETLRQHQFVVARRLAHNRALGNAVHQAVPTAAWPDTTVTPTIRTPTRR
jgi:hypothetical protein